MRKNRQTAKYHIKSYIIAGSLAGAISMALALPVPVMAAQQSLASVTGQAQIQPMGDGSGKYMMKSDGFYCLDVNGAGSTQAEIHYFQDYEIDGTVFDGYYYHDADGKFKACSPHMEHLKGVAVFGDKTDEEADTQNAQEAEKFDGYYFVNNLGRLSAAPQVRYIDNLAIDGITLNGYYYFDENGRLIPELRELAPKGDRRIGSNPHANGGKLLRDLRLPDFRKYGIDVPKPSLISCFNDQPAQYPVSMERS